MRTRSYSVLGSGSRIPTELASYMSACMQTTAKFQMVRHGQEAATILHTCVHACVHTCVHACVHTCVHRCRAGRRRRRSCQSWAPLAGSGCATRAPRSTARALTPRRSSLGVARHASAHCLSHRGRQSSTPSKSRRTTSNSARPFSRRPWCATCECRARRQDMRACMHACAHPSIHPCIGARRASAARRQGARACE